MASSESQITMRAVENSPRVTLIRLSFLVILASSSQSFWASSYPLSHQIFDDIFGNAGISAPDRLDRCFLLIFDSYRGLQPTERQRGRVHNVAEQVIACFPFGQRSFAGD